MRWYEEDLNVTIELPHQRPPYVEDEDIKELIETIKHKQTHKESIPRDILLVEVAYGSGHSLE
jgi:hypothetical protein